MKVRFVPEEGWIEKQQLRTHLFVSFDGIAISEIPGRISGTFEDRWIMYTQKVKIIFQLLESSGKRK